MFIENNFPTTSGATARHADSFYALLPARYSAILERTEPNESRRKHRTLQGRTDARRHA